MTHTHYPNYRWMLPKHDTAASYPWHAKDATDQAHAGPAQCGQSTPKKPTHQTRRNSGHRPNMYNSNTSPRRNDQFELHVFGRGGGGAKFLSKPKILWAVSRSSPCQATGGCGRAGDGACVPVLGPPRPPCPLQTPWPWERPCVKHCRPQRGRGVKGQKQRLCDVTLLVPRKTFGPA